LPLLFQNKELNALVKAHSVILFCNQEQCPFVYNTCEITADVMDDIKPHILMIEECRELFAILTTPHIRVSQIYPLWVYDLSPNASLPNASLPTVQVHPTITFAQPAHTAIATATALSRSLSPAGLG